MNQFKLSQYRCGFIFFFIFLLEWTAFGFGRQMPSVNSSRSLWVVRADGTQSCGMKEGQPIEEAAQELKSVGVNILDARKGSDGKMHIMVCGAPEGSINAFLIAEEDLSKVLPLGFQKAPEGFILK
jgi:hypothetical protein